jgi:hypothetical protein
MPFKNPHPLYTVWMSMKDRCRNPNNHAWKNYGARGIFVCDEWQSDFWKFVEDMGPRPDGYTLDRIDNEKGYFPENCRWASRSQQQRNRRVTVYVEVEGRRHKAIDLAKIAGVKTDTIVNRAAKGFSYDKVIAKEKLQDLSGFALGGKAFGEKMRARTHCSRGHKYTEGSFNYIAKDNARRCKVCRTKSGKLDPILR